MRLAPALRKSAMWFSGLLTSRWTSFMRSVSRPARKGAPAVIFGQA